LGPLAAFVILTARPRAFDLVFVVSFSIAIVGVACIALFVDNATPGEALARHASLTEPFKDARFRRTLLVACLLAMATVSDAFVYLLLQRTSDFGPQFFPLLAVATAASYVLLAVPAGRVADRIGRVAVFIAGHVALLGMYATLWLSNGGIPIAFVCVLLLGTYYAMTDGVLAAAASAVLPSHSRGNGLALLGTGVSLSRLAASVLFGWAWSRHGTTVALGAFALALGIAILVALIARPSLAPARP
jgi:MFS family permease